ncbi:MAG TPA: NAD(P)-dependent alcohol dehydrogenase, partial [Gaiellaceae bacterium]|nr:NAD(P)-dependent alcohol dehydrogenase [Gaiellaceae bacterium]
MKAAALMRYGSLVLRDLEAPEPDHGRLLVRVRATSVNAVDWYGFSGRPYFARPLMGVRRPRDSAIGSDFAGVVAAVGDGTNGFAPGDQVYGCKSGSFAEYVVAGDAVARKPADISFEEAAAVPVAGLTALQGLRDHGGVRAGHKVLVNGAGGGVGTFAV